MDTTLSVSSSISDATDPEVSLRVNDTTAAPSDGRVFISSGGSAAVELVEPVPPRGRGRYTRAARKAQRKRAKASRRRNR